MTSNVLLHSNRGTGHYTVRQDREIVLWLGKKPSHCIVKSPVGATFLVTKGTFASASKLGRVVLKPYIGNWPRLSLVWEIVKEIVND